MADNHAYVDDAERAAAAEEGGSYGAARGEGVAVVEVGGETAVTGQSPSRHHALAARQK